MRWYFRRQCSWFLAGKHVTCSITRGVFVSHRLHSRHSHTPTLPTRATLQSEQTLLAPDPQRNTLIYFFAPWCSICRASINNLDGIDEEFTRVVVVALDYDSTQSVQDFIDDVGLNRPVLLGNSEIQAIFRIKGYPSYYILDRDFQVISRDMGYTSEFGLRARAWRAKPDLANKHN